MTVSIHKHGDLLPGTGACVQGSKSRVWLNPVLLAHVLTGDGRRDDCLHKDGDSLWR